MGREWEGASKNEGERGMRRKSMERKRMEARENTRRNI